MVDSKIVLSAVEYLNTKPFIEGLSTLESKEELKIIQETPAQCSARLQHKKADIGLVPVADLATLPDFRPITSWGIGAEGPVQSVILVANNPVEELQQILLDSQSKTSNQLMQILADDYFNITPSFPELGPSYLDQVEGPVGAVLIGDRALTLASNFTYQYDLAEAWHQLTGLPFLFARWVASSRVDDYLEEDLEMAFEKGMQHREQIANQMQAQFEGVDIYHYLMKCIQYKVTDRHRDALELFLDKIALKAESL